MTEDLSDFEPDDGVFCTSMPKELRTQCQKDKLSLPTDEMIIAWVHEMRNQKNTGK